VAISWGKARDGERPEQILAKLVIGRELWDKTEKFHVELLAIKKAGGNRTT
jgi:hypothetical protein